MKKSAGILVYRKKNNKIEILLVHPGGPYWQNRDLNTWSIPKGEITEKDGLTPITTQIYTDKTNYNQRKSASSQNESTLIKETAIREFEEETGLKLHKEDIENLKYLGEVKSPNKILYIFVLEKDFGDKFEIKSNLIEIEWPPKSGKIIKIPEVDKVNYFDFAIAKKKLINYQKNIIDIFLKKYKNSN